MRRCSWPNLPAIAIRRPKQCFRTFSRRSMNEGEKIMSAIVMPFPLTRRHGFAARHAEIIASLKPKSAKRHLDHQLKIQRETMQRRGVAEELIERELKALA